MQVEIVAADTVPAAELDAFLRAAWGAESVVAHGERFFPSRLPGFAAVSGGRVPMRDELDLAFDL